MAQFHAFSDPVLRQRGAKCAARAADYALSILIDGVPVRTDWGRHRLAPMCARHPGGVVRRQRSRSGHDGLDTDVPRARDVASGSTGRWIGAAYSRPRGRGMCRPR